MDKYCEGLFSKKRIITIKKYFLFFCGIWLDFCETDSEVRTYLESLIYCLANKFRQHALAWIHDPHSNIHIQISGF